MMYPRDATSSSLKPIPTPFNFQPSGTFDGVDGSWSTFGINVGDNGNGVSGQSFKVLISTAGSATWVPLAADWCIVPDPETCAKNRGIQPFQAQQILGFESNASSTWKQEGLFNLDLKSNLDYGNDTENGAYGFDNVGLGMDSTTSPMLSSQVVAGIHTRDYFMGMFGLSTTPLNFGDGPLATFLEVFKNASQIPSLSYGYTAGAHYQNKGVLGNLILGGYDSSRFGTAMSFTMPGGGNSTLLVNVESIIVIPDPKVDQNQYSATVNDGAGFYATVDSTLPYLWLPQDVCDQMQKIFRLTYDNSTQLYTVNDTMREQNLHMNPTINIKLSNTAANSNNFITISLPYAAFDLQAQWPIYSNATNYFPIKRSTAGNYVLGRSFLQEAYIIVDYERENFTIAQAAFSDPMPSSTIVAIEPLSGGPSPVSTSNPLAPGGSKSGLSAGAIAGVAIAGVVCLIIIAILWYFFRRLQLKKKQPIQVIHRPDDQILPGSPPPYDPAKGRRVSELDTPTPGYASSRTSSQGYFGNGLESPDLASVEMRMKQDASYFADPVTRMRASSEAASLNSDGPFELAADHGMSEASTDPQTPLRTTQGARPQMKRRKRSNGSGGNHTSGEAPRVEVIAEDPNEGTSPLSNDSPTHVGTASRFQEDLSDGHEDEVEHPADQALPLIRYHSDHDRPTPMPRMSVDEAVGLDIGEPGPMMQDHIEPVSASISRASSITIAEPPKEEDMRP